MYITRPKLWTTTEEYDPPNKFAFIPSLEVMEGSYINTGIIDLDGNAIYRAPDEAKFVRGKEE